MRLARRSAAILLVSLLCVACDTPAQEPKGYHRTQFAQVEGQPDPVPAEWVSTPEGKLAHSIKLPNPLPKDSGYRKGMDSKAYFAHLCKAEVGEFIYKTVDNVEGFYFARLPKWPTDDDLQDRYKLEAPEIERTFQLIVATPQDRAKNFVNPSWNLYSFVEEPATHNEAKKAFVKSYGYRQDVSSMQLEDIGEMKSRVGMVWRGLKRQNDRDLLVAGSEWIVFDLETKEVLAVQPNFAITGLTRNTRDGIYWLSSPSCPGLHQNNLATRVYKFSTKSLRPVPAAPR